MPQRFDADEVQIAIRKYIFKTKVPAARAAGETIITLRASELHGARTCRCGWSKWRRLWTASGSPSRMG